MSRFATTVGVVAVGVALAAAGAGLSIAIAGAAPEPYRVQAAPAAPVEVERPEPLDLSSLDAINQHLRSRGFDPSTFVVQRGARNYAGPNCPGLGWNCTTATRVVQIATSGTVALSSFSTLDDTTVNEAECVPESGPLPGFLPPGTVGCAIVQTALAGPEVDQQASCKVESKVPKKQFCDIVQENDTGGDNQAVVSMKIDSTTGPTQLGDQEAAVFQDAEGGGNNQLQSDQTIALAARGSATTQDGYQSLVLDQDVGFLFVDLPPPAEDLEAPATGNNQAQVNQSQNLTASTATAGSTQNQNAGTALFGDPCNGEVDDANSCVDYDQDTGSGKNQIEVNQYHDLKATSTTSNVTQVQGCEPEDEDKPCGLEEVGEQETDEDSKNEAQVVQDGTWVLEAPRGAGLKQIQDPHFGGAFTNQCCSRNDMFTLTQKAVLRALPPDPILPPSPITPVRIQSHKNSVEDQSTGTVLTKSTIVLNDLAPSVVACRSDALAGFPRCSYDQHCRSTAPATPSPGPFCPRNGEGTATATTPTTLPDS